MRDDTLLDMVQHMTDRVGLVHQMPFTCDRDGFAATFEKIFFGTVQSRIYLTADLLGIICHTGMSCLMRKDVLEALGGLRVFGCYLAEDFFIAKAFIDNGWRTSVSSQPAMQNSGVCDISSFQARLTRWAKLRVAMMPTMVLLEPLSECMVIGACASWAVTVLFRWDALVFYLVHVLMWFLSDWILLSVVQVRFENHSWKSRFSSPNLLLLAYRTDRCLSTNSNLSSDGCCANALLLTCFSTLSGIQQFGGDRGSTNSPGEESRTNSATRPALI